MKKYLSIKSLILFVFLLAAIVAGTLYIRQSQELRKQAGGVSANLSMKPSTLTIPPVGNELLIGVILNASTLHVTGAEVNFYYDPNLVKITGFDVGKPLPVVLSPAKDNNGQYSITLGAQPNTYLLGADIIGTLKVKTLTNKPTSIGFQESVVTALESPGNIFGTGTGLKIGSTTCVPLPPCAYNTDPNGAICKLGAAPAEGGAWCPRPSPPIVKNRIVWKTDDVSLLANDLTFTANGKMFSFNPTGPVSVRSDPADSGDPNYTTLEVIWQENGVEMRMFIYFRAYDIRYRTDAQGGMVAESGQDEMFRRYPSVRKIWKVTELRIYNGNPRGDWIYFKGGDVITVGAPVGQAFTAENLNLSSSENGIGKITFNNIQLQAFLRQPPPTPTTVCKIGINSYGVLNLCKDSSMAARASFNCYDGTSGVVGDGVTCRAASELNAEAKLICAGRSSCSTCNPIPSGCTTDANGNISSCRQADGGAMWCLPTPKPLPPNCYYRPGKCTSQPCNPIIVCPTPIPTPQGWCTPNGSTCTLPGCAPCPEGRACPAYCRQMTGVCQNNKCVPTPTPTPTPSKTPTPTPYPQVLELWVRLAGVTDKEANGAKINVKFYLKNGSVKQLSAPLTLIHNPASFTPSGQGGIYVAKANIPNPFPVGTQLRIKVKGEKHAAVDFCKAQGQTGPCGDNDYITIPKVSGTYVLYLYGIPLPPGDLPVQDGKVDKADIDKIAALMNKLQIDLSTQEKYVGDVDYNGVINVRDIFLVRQTLETRYD